jgi:AcrR family transcriptional regulator
LSDTQKDELIKAAIINAADNLFQKWGLNKTTMEEIAKASGKGKSTLYYYFKSKEEIFDICLIKEMDEIFKLVKEAVANANTFETKMRAYLFTNLQELRKRVNIYSIVRSEISQNEGFIKKVRTLFDTEEINLIREILNFGASSCEISNFTEEEIISLSYIIMIAFQSIEIELFVEHKFLNDDEKIDSLIDILIHGIKR